MMKRIKRASWLLAIVMLVMFLAPQFLLNAKAETVSLDTLLEGKTISILGDSISTYWNYSVGPIADTTNSTIRERHYWYPTNAQEVTDPSHTWWLQTVDALGLELLVNNSWSASYILKDRVFDNGLTAEGAWKDRCVQLHDDTGDNAGQAPDIIAFFLGTNDFGADYANIGTFDAVDFDSLITGSEGSFTYATPATSMEAYAICLHKMQQAYPDAEIYCFTILNVYGNKTQPTAFNADVKKMAEHYGCHIVDLQNQSGVTTDLYAFELMTEDNIHPAKKGMDGITNAFVASILRNSKYVPDDITIYDISYDLTDVISLDGTADGVLAGQPLTLELVGSASYRKLDKVTVTMGGQDITASCYADGVISIPEVTGDVSVTANSVLALDGHSHDCEHCDDNAVWVPWTGKVEELYQGGHFYLPQDATMSKDVYTESLGNPDIDVTICLNGKTLKGSTGARMFRLSGGTDLTIVDCTAKTENGVYTAGKLVPQYHGVKGAVAGIYSHADTTKPGSTFTMYDGIIDGGNKGNDSVVNANNIGGGLIDLNYAKGRVNLYGGVLKDYTSYYGGAVFVGGGLLTVDGATIQNCKATRGMAIMVRGYGEAVIESGQILGGNQYHGVISMQNNAKLTINGGKIGDATGNYAYGIHISGAGISVVMNGGEISGNAKQGVWIENGTFTLNGGKITNNFHGVLMDNGTLNMTGGEICYNTSANEGAGVRINGGVFNMSGGKIHGNNCTGSSSGVGGVRVSTTFNMTGGEIYNNGSPIASCSQVATIAAGAKMDISGDAKITKYSKNSLSVNSYIGTTTISGGTYVGSVNAGVNGTLTISGGTFDMRVDKYLAEGYIQLLSGAVDVPCTKHSFANGACTRCGLADERTKILEGVTLSVLGDSISTFKGVSDTTGAETSNSTIYNNAYCYPTAYMSDLNSTWWMQASQMLGMDLLVNNSWSGSYLLKERVYTDGRVSAPGAYIDRCVQLHDDTGDNAGETPDIIAFYLGTNDFNSDYANIGTYAAVDFDTLITGSEGAYTYATPTTAMEAYAICLHKMKQAYPDAEVYCFTLLPRIEAGQTQPEQFNADIKKMAERFGAFVVDLYEDSGITGDLAAFDAMMGDNLHPNPDGMDALTGAFVASILKNSKYVSDTVAVYDISYDLDDVVGFRGTPKAVQGGLAFELKLIGAASYLDVNNVTVTMGGEDITASCYADGVITIPEITGNVAITADAVKNVADHTHDCEHCDDGAEWTPWNGDVNALYYGGHFYLTEDAAMDMHFNPANLQNPDVDVTICLNGYTLSGPNTDRMFRLSGGADVTITDCTAKVEDGVYTAGSIVPVYQGIRGVVVGIFDSGKSSFTMYDGIINGNGRNNTAVVDIDHVGGGLLDMNVPGEINLYGGVLKDYTSYYGGGVYVGNGTLTIDGATIENCNATRGRAVMVNGSGAVFNFKSGELKGGTQYHSLVALAKGGKMTMSGGKISGAKGNYGYGVHVIGAACVFDMTGGEICGNEQQGVYVENGTFNFSAGKLYGNAIGILQSTGTVNMTGGEIYNNTSSLEGAGVRQLGGTFNMSAGKIYNNVSNGTGTGTGGVRADGTFNMTGGEIYGNDGLLIGDAQIMPNNTAAKITISGDVVITSMSEKAHSVNCFKGTATISGGTFTGTVAEGANGTLSITGGMFDTDVTAFVAEGYQQYISGQVGLVCTEHEFENGACIKCGEEDPTPSCEHEYVYLCDAHCVICGELTNENAAHAMKHVPAVAATCQTMGNIAYWTCEYCGGCWDNENALGMPLNAMMVKIPGDHNYVDGICGTCGEADPDYIKKFDLKGSSMTLGNTLEINFAVENVNISEGDYIVVSKEYADGSVVSKTYTQDEWTAQGSKIRYVSFSVTAKEMNDQLTVIVYNENGQQISETYTDSVAGYCLRKLNEEEKRAAGPRAKYLTLYVDMLNYGAAAQQKWTYNTDALANAELTETQKGYATVIGEKANILQKGEGYKGTSLSLKDNILMNVAYEATSLENVKYAVVTFIDHNGNDESVTVAIEDFVTQSSSTKYISIDVMAVADYAQPVTVKLYNADGECVSTTIDSMGSYAGRQTKDVYLYEAILAFGMGAYNYFHS